MQLAVGRKLATRTKPHRLTEWGETHFGQLQNVSPSISKITPHGRANQPQAIDRDRGNTIQKNNNNLATFNRQKLSSNFYFCLSPPTCQVEEHESVIPLRRPALQKRAEVTKEIKMRPHHWQQDYIIDVDNAELKEGIATGIIPSTFADSAATSGVGTKHDPCR